MSEMFAIWEFMYLIRVVDCDLEAAEDLPCRWMLVHGDFKFVLWPIFSIKGWGMVVEINHTDSHCGNIIVLELIVWAYLRCLQFKRYTSK